MTTTYRLSAQAAAAIGLTALGLALAPAAAFADDEEKPSSPASPIMRGSDRGIVEADTGIVRVSDIGTVLPGVPSHAGAIAVHDGNMASMPKAVLDLRQRMHRK